MPAELVHRSKASTSTSASSPGPASTRKPPLSIAKRDPSGLPGISKIKSSLRQTARLLSKDSLEPGLRLQTERRLRSLQADLERAERRGVEKKNGERYHKVKFFERQKLTRLIKRIQRQVSTAAATSAEHVRWSKDLFKARVMLNYILHYPNERKYISLFPITNDKEELLLPSWLDDNPDPPHPTGKGDRQRQEVLDTVTSMMSNGEMSVEPEKDLHAGHKVQILSGDAPGGASGREEGLRISGKGDRSAGKLGKGRKGASGAGGSRQVIAGQGATGTGKEEEDEDDFFEAD